MDSPSSVPDDSSAAQAPRRKRWLGKLLLGLLAVLVVFAVVVQLQPAEFRVERSITIAAPPATVFEHINNLQKSNVWSPFDDPDPNLQMTYSGPEAGEGAVMKWNGNDEVGEGEMTIVESRAPEYMKARLKFIRPMEGVNDVEYVLKPQADQTTVTWIMTGEQNFLMKAVCLFLDMDQEIGGLFETGLADLKKVVEHPASPSAG